MLTVASIVGSPQDKPGCAWGDASTGSCPDIAVHVDEEEATLRGTMPGGAGGGDTTADPAPERPSTDEVQPPPQEAGQPPTRSNGSPTAVDGMGGLGQRMIIGDDLAAAPFVREPFQIVYVGIDDIAHFRPSAGITFMEPDGWAVKGVPANFWTETPTQILNGELLGVTASVRFTPLRYRWDYGDGATVFRSLGGGSWKTLGVDEFADTTTAHAFSTSGTYVVQPSIDFTAEYQFGPGEWTPIDGVVRASTNPLTVVVTGAATVLVGRDCLAAPGAVGC
jgi:hypothetical protein